VALREGRLYVTLNMKANHAGGGHTVAGAGATPPHAHAPWHDASWRFAFHNASDEASGDVEGATFGREAEGHTLIVHAPLPAGGLRVAAGGAPAAAEAALLWRVTLRAALPDGAALHYPAVPFCAARSAAAAPAPPPLQLPPPPPRYRLAACTSVTLQFAHLMPEWMAYHATVQGYDHFYVYINDEAAPARTLLRAFADAGLATLVDFEWAPQHKGHLVYQQAAENACLLRARGEAAWVALHDVDEFATGPRGNTSSRLADVLPPGDHEGGGGDDALRLLTQWYGHNADAQQQAALDAAWPTLVLGRMRTPGQVVHGSRQKCVMRPRAVRYFNVHTVTAGAPMREVPPGEARLMHFKQAFYMQPLDGAPEDALLPAAAATRERLRAMAAAGYPELLIRPPPPPPAAPAS
jgi:hypothetical protein